MDKIKFRKILVAYIILIISIYIIYTVNVKLAITLSPLLPLFLLLIRVKNALMIFDYRNFYLLGLLFWSSGKSLPLMGSLFYNDIELNNNYYILSIILSPMLVFLFKRPLLIDNRLFKAKIMVNNENKKKLLPSFLFFIFIFTLYYMVWINVQNMQVFFISTFILKALILLLISYCSLKIDLHKYSHIFLASVILTLSVFLYSLDSSNRTSYLLPLSVICSGIYISNYKYINSILVYKKFIFSIFIILFFVIILFIADLHKKYPFSDIDSFFSIVMNYDFLKDVIINSNYYQKEIYSLDYFYVLNELVKNNLSYPGALLFQLASSVTPRIFFPSKEVTNLSLLLWEDGITPGPLYYELFLEPLIDSGVFGVLLYFSLFLFINSVVFNIVIKSIKTFNINFSISVYIINLIIIFYALRGPSILIIWYLLLPNFILFGMNFFSNSKNRIST